MRTDARWWAVSTMVLTLGLWFLPAGEPGKAADAKDGGLPIAEGDFRKLVAHSTKVIQKALSDKPDKKNLDKARLAAVMIAAYAQYAQGGPSEQEKGTLRAAALKLADTIKAGKTADAKKQADALATLKPDASAKPASGSLLKDAKMELGDVMHQFAATSEGGLGIDGQLKLLNGSAGEIPKAKLTDELAMTSYQIAAAAELAKEHTPDKNPEQFKMMAENVRETAVDMAKATKDKDGPLALKVVYKLSINCNKCHQKFRD